MAVPLALAADDTYYFWASATGAWSDVDTFKAKNWSTSNTEYVAPADGTVMNSTSANWVFDYDAYLPTSSRNDAIYYRITESNLTLGSISIINHNRSETSYYGADGTLIEGGATYIKINSKSSNSVWNIGTFNYTGSNGDWDRGVNFGVSNTDASQADITIGTMNIGSSDPAYEKNVTSFNIGDYAVGIGYATVESGKVKVGDLVSLSDAAGPKRLTITGDFNMYGNATISMNVWDNAKDALHSEVNPDVVIGGVVNMSKNSNGISPTWNVLNRSSAVYWATGKPAPKPTDTYIKLGGLSGYGKVSNTSETLKASKVKLIFTNTEDYTFDGSFTQNSEESGILTVMSIKMAGTNGKKQIIKADSKLTGTLEVESGTLLMKSTAATGKLTMTGGAFGGINGGVRVSAADWTAGDIMFYSAEALNGGTPDKITIDGAFTKLGAGQINIDFAAYDVVDTGIPFDLITAGSLVGFNSDANEDFIGKNINGGYANFAWNGNTLTVEFTNVPEPATIAAILGGLALAFAFSRRRK